ncbi:MAG: ABC transporter ATP-binding protein [Candidatus Woesearchaeota archaeon]
MKKKRVSSKKSKLGKDGSIIVCNGITKQYGKNKVLTDLNLSIKEGEIFGIIGMSGSGKTTLLNIIIGFLQPEAGDIHFKTDRGMLPFSKAPNLIKPLFGFAPQEPSFYPKLTAQENLEYFATLYGISRADIKKNTAELLKLVDLTAFTNHLAKELSFGMQKRLGIACALVHKPKILILDEPTADLDPILRRETWDLVSKVNKTGTTIIVASHLLDELESECDRIAVLHDGKISKLGSIDQLKKLYTTNNEVILVTASKNYKKISSKMKSKRSLRISKIVQKDSSLVLQTPFAEEALAQLIKIIKRSKDHIVKLHIARPSLEEVFINAHKK